MPKKKTTTKGKRAQTKDNFWSFKPSVQTVYWLILSILVLALAVWVLQLTIQTQEIYDEVRYLTTTSLETPLKKE